LHLSYAVLQIIYHKIFVNRQLYQVSKGTSQIINSLSCQSLYHNVKFILEKGVFEMIIIFALAILGILDTGYLSYIHLFGGQACDQSSNKELGKKRNYMAHLRIIFV
jgi:hypothetical protein